MRDNLETRIVAALRGGLSAAGLAVLTEETETAIAQAEVEAQAERGKALDPLSSPNPRQARAAMEDAAFRYERLRSLLPRLQARYEKVVAAEEGAEWKARYHLLKRERDALANELLEVYPQAVAQLANLFSRIAANNAKCHKLHQIRPAGVRQHLSGAELKARELDRFSILAPEISKELKLPCWEDSSKLVWPLPQLPLAVSAAACVPSPSAGPKWFEGQRARAAAERSEAERTARYYAQEQREREDRQKNR